MTVTDILSSKKVTHSHNLNVSVSFGLLKYFLFKNVALIVLYIFGQVEIYAEISKTNIEIIQ